MNHVFCWVKSVLPFSRFLSCFFSWRFCGNNEAEGTCFLQAPKAGCSHYQPITRAQARRCFLEVRGSTVEGPQTPAELSHPLSSPLPAPWWVVASWAYCPCSADKRWKFDGTFQLLSPYSTEKKKKKPMTSSSIGGQWYPVRGLPVNQFAKVLSVIQKRGLHFRKWILHEEYVSFISRKEYYCKQFRSGTSFNEFYLTNMFWRSVFFLMVHNRRRNHTHNPCAWCRQ